jgi:iron-sulfur cluster assembly protein
MLAITHGAAEAIRQIVTSSPVAEEGGLRISIEPVDTESARLELSVAESPAPGDALVQKEGAKVFVEETAARFLADKVLDARIEDERVAFLLAERDWSHNGQPENFDPRDII